MNTVRVVLKPEKDKPIRGFHPWIFSGAIDLLDDHFKTGDLVKVYSASEEFLGTGYLNPRSQIAVRMLSFKDEPIDLAFFVGRMEADKKLREEILTPLAALHLFLQTDINRKRLRKYLRILMKT